MQENKYRSKKVDLAETPVAPEMNDTKKRRSEKNASADSAKTGGASSGGNKKDKTVDKAGQEGAGVKATGEIHASDADKKVLEGESYGYEFGEPSQDKAAFIYDTEPAGKYDSPTTKREGSNKAAVNGGATAKAKKRSNENVKAIAWTLIVLAAIIILIIVLSNTGSSAGIIKGRKVSRYGEENTVSLNLNDYKYRKGDTITWTVDDKEVQKKAANDKTAFNFDTSKLGVGSHVVKAMMGGKEIAMLSITVDKPLLKVEAQSLEVVYGEEIPELKCRVSGLVDGDSEETLGIAGLATSEAVRFSKVGKYPVTVGSINNDKYDVELIEGAITVLPRRLTLKTSVFLKEYDGSDLMELKGLVPEGAINGDALTLNAKAKFSDKNAGKDKAVTLEDVMLSGTNSENYTVDVESMKGEITPKCVVLKSVVANDKIFDGTTNVTFCKVGALEGAVEKDSVAVGEITAAFTNGKPGKNVKVEIFNVTLVGEDSKNYLIEVDCDVKADIMRMGENSVLPGGNGGAVEDRRNEVA